MEPDEKEFTNSGQAFEADVERLYGTPDCEELEWPSSGCPSSTDSRADSSSGQESA